MVNHLESPICCAGGGISDCEEPSSHRRCPVSAQCIVGFDTGSLLKGHLSAPLSLSLSSSLSHQDV